MGLKCVLLCVLCPSLLLDRGFAHRTPGPEEGEDGKDAKDDEGLQR